MVVVTMNFFLMTYIDNSFFGYAKAPKDLNRTVLPETGVIGHWEKPNFILTKGEFADYLNCDISWPLFSAELKNIVSNFAQNKEELQWLEVQVKKNEECSTYFIPHLIVKPDLLNPKMSFFGPGNLLIKPVFDKQKIGSRDIFSLLKRRYTIYVSQRLRKEIERNKLCGYHFEKTRVS
jgi:hypothetical protein